MRTENNRSRSNCKMQFNCREKLRSRSAISSRSSLRRRDYRNNRVKQKDRRDSRGTYSSRASRNRRERHSRRDESSYYNNNDHNSRNKSSRLRSSDQSVNIDKDGYLIMKEGHILNKRYKVVKLLGEGTFGRVARCVDCTNQAQDVAVKVIKSVKKYREAAMLEIKVLDKIKKYDSEGRYFCVFALDWFDYHGHICITFPLLGPSVFDFLEANDFAGYPIRQVRFMTAQMIRAIGFLHSLKITHTDLKPENILFVNGAFDIEYDAKRKRNIRIIRDASLRIIDFGNAIFDYEDHTTIVATRHYRPLEVILELGWSYPCDVWSLGCIIFEMYTGSTMFMTHSNTEHMAMMERVLGHFPARMTRRSKQQKYFDSCGRLKWDQDSKAGKDVRSDVKPVRRYMSRDDDMAELDLFDLIEEMLEYNPKKRITLCEARRHPFVSVLSGDDSEVALGRTRT